MPPPTSITFRRLTEVSPVEILTQMNDDRVARHLPLMTGQWDTKTLKDFVDMKEACWARDGLGHRAIFCDGTYVGWGGFQKEGDEWDFGLVLTAKGFGLGLRITRILLAEATRDPRIPYVTFLLPPSRTRLRGLDRLGAVLVGDVLHAGERFLKYRLDTETPSPGHEQALH